MKRVAASLLLVAGATLAVPSVVAETTTKKAVSKIPRTRRVGDVINDTDVGFRVTVTTRGWKRIAPGRNSSESDMEFSSRHSEDWAIVFVMEDGVARARPVETGISDQERIEILAGIDADCDVIVGPFRELD